MVSQALGCQGGGGRRRSQLVPCLFRQGSLYSLTLDEVQNRLGQPLHGMNLDDLLAKVLPWEDNFSMHRTLNKKTVGEVWKDIRQKKRGERQITFGETTLEEFLENAGIVTEGGDVERRNSEGGNGAPQVLAEAPHWLQQYQYQQQKGLMEVHVPCQPVPTPLRIGSSSILDAVLQDGQMEMSAPLAGEVSDSVAPGRKRGHRTDSSGKTVEIRRQKRMIMNRESAARSRARKQAYTNELENKISRLEEENDRLRKRKELDTILHCAPPPEPNYHLRRSSSAPF